MPLASVGSVKEQPDPMAVEEPPLAFTLVPKAAEPKPLASAWFPKAVVAKLVAFVKVPRASAPELVASALIPIANEFAASVAFAPVPRAIDLASQTPQVEPPPPLPGARKPRQQQALGACRLSRLWVMRR